MAKHSKKHEDEPDRTPDEEPGMSTRSFRLPKDLMDWLDREAKKRKRTANNYLDFILSRMRARREGEDRGQAS